MRYVTVIMKFSTSRAGLRLPGVAVTGVRLLCGIVWRAMGTRTTSAGEARQAARKVAALLARKPRVRLVYLFGSAADATHVGVRGIDLAILTEPAQPLDELMQWRADLAAAVHLPLDLVSLNDASVALAYEVVEHGNCLYANPPEAETEFVLPSLEYSHLSSRHIKEIAAFGGDVRESLPQLIATEVASELSRRLNSGSLEN